MHDVANVFSVSVCVHIPMYVCAHNGLSVYCYVVMGVWVVFNKCCLANECKELQLLQVIVSV